jgi:cytochrome c-type protein NapB
MSQRRPNEPPPPSAPLSQRLLLPIVAAGSMVLALVAVFQTTVTPRRTNASTQGDTLVLAAAPIAHEQQVFRMTPASEAIDPDVRRRSTAHPRTLATERLLRSYPGAPPRVPHGLTAVEFRTGHCKTCHERGGYTPRFEAYAPVTPHPEWTACLTCHATNSAQFALVVPRSGPNAVCRQCHAGTPTRFDESAVDWRSSRWPQPAPHGSAGTPPAIPHELQTRGNCLACHMGPGAVAEIRTTHPQRADCRGCHVLAGAGESLFVRPQAVSTAVRRSVP